MREPTSASSRRSGGAGVARRFAPRVLAGCLAAGVLAGAGALGEEAAPPTPPAGPPTGRVVPGSGTERPPGVVGPLPGEREVPLPPPVEPPKPAEKRERLNLRLGLWLPVSRSTFRLDAGPGHLDVNVEEDVGDKKFPLSLTLPVDAVMRFDDKEIRLRYLFWNVEESGTPGFVFDFGNVPVLGTDRVKMSMDTDVLGLDFLQRLWGSATSGSEGFLTAGCDFFFTKADLTNLTTPGSDSLEETVPVFSVGLGVRFKIKEKWSLFVSSSALSYAQLLLMQDSYFNVEDTFRNIEVSARYDRSKKTHFGFGWKHYEVGFENAGVRVYERLVGVAGYMNFVF